jgi:deazaflavin-dependent oxidoreductase (nitroreductase family)
MSNIGSLHVWGRRTGVMRTVRLRYANNPDGSVLISAGGLSEQWPLNLRANPAGQFELGGEVRHYHAIEQSVRRFRLDPV